MSRGTSLGSRIRGAFAPRDASHRSEGSGAPSHAHALGLFAPTRLALLALSAAALLMALLAGSARAAYTAGVPLPVSGMGNVDSVAVNQRSRDVYVAELGDTSGGSGGLTRFDSSGASISCALPPVVTNPSGVAVDPITDNVYLGDLFSFGFNYQVHTFDATCASEVGTAFPISPVPGGLVPQPGTDAAGNLYLPNAADDTVKKFQPDGTPVPLANPITGLANPSSVALDVAGNIYVAETGAAGVNETQRPTFSSFVTTDTFTLGNLPGACANATTANITFDSVTGTRNSNIDAGLENACSAGANNDFDVSGTSNVTVRFQGQLAATDVPLMTCAKVTGAGTCNVTQLVQGAPAIPGKVSRFAPDGAPSGTFASTTGTSTVTVNKSNGNVFVGVGRGSTFHIEKYNSAGTRLDDFGAGLFGDITGTNIYNQLAVDETSGTVYAADAGNREVEVFLSSRALSVVKSGTGTGRVTSNVGGIDCGSTCSADFAEGDRPTLTATPDSGSVFTGWSGGGCSGTGTCQVTIGLSDVEVTANFDPVPAPAVTSIAPTHGPAAGGTEVTITGTDLTGATRVRFGSTDATTFTVNGATQIRATAPAGTKGTTVNIAVTTPGGTSANVAADDYAYDLPNHSLTVNKAGAGSGSITCDGGACAASYVEGTRVVLAATADRGSSFAGFSGGGCSTTSPCEVTISAPTTVTATFTLNDTDRDGVPDNTDACPSQAASTANGCPAPAVDPPPATCATDPSLCPPAVNKLGPCVKKANQSYKKALKAAKRKRGKARAKAIKAAKKKKTRSVSRCKASFSRPSL